MHFLRSSVFGAVAVICTPSFCLAEDTGLSNLRGHTNESAVQNSTQGFLESLAARWCEQPGGICGGPWKLPKLCCVKAKCESLLEGDGTKKCVEQHPEPRCAPVGHECGHRGQQQQQHSCCGNARCEKLLGGDGTMKCVEQHPADQTCAREHAECGGPGRLTIPCCAPHFSCKAPWHGAVMKYMYTCEAEETCAKAHADCGGPGRLTIPCCAPHLSCKAPWHGAAVMKCV